MSYDHRWRMLDTDEPARHLRTVSRWECPSCGKRLLIDSYASEEGYRHTVARRSIEEMAEREIQTKRDAGCPCGSKAEGQP